MPRGQKGKRKTKTTQQQGGNIFGDIYRGGKKLLTDLDRELKRVKPLTAIDSAIGSGTRSALLGAIPGVGGYANQAFALGKQRGYKKGKKK